MKCKPLKAPLLLLFVCVVQTLVFSQDANRQFDLRPDPIQEYRNQNPPNFRNNETVSTSPELIDNDIGIQRPVETKKVGFGYHLGFETKIYHTNNPASVEGGVFKTSAGVWENAWRNNFLLGAYDLGGASFSPLITLNYSKFTHFGDSLFSTFDFDSLNLNFVGIFQFSNGWSLRPSLGFTADLNPRKSLERQYSQLNPSLTLGKYFQMNHQIQTFLSGQLHITLLILRTLCLGNPMIT